MRSEGNVVVGRPVNEIGGVITRRTEHNMREDARCAVRIIAGTRFSGGRRRRTETETQQCCYGHHDESHYVNLPQLVRKFTNFPELVRKFSHSENTGIESPRRLRLPYAAVIT